MIICSIDRYTHTFSPSKHTCSFGSNGVAAHVTAVTTYEFLGKARKRKEENPLEQHIDLESEKKTDK